MTRRALELLPLALALAVVAGVSSLGAQGGVLDGLVRPPLVVRILLVMASLLVAIACLAGAAARLHPDASPATLVRGVRLLFLAVGAVAAAGGWAVASPLPIVAGLIIGGVDVLETSFLLAVAATRPGREGR